MGLGVIHNRIVAGFFSQTTLKCDSSRTKNKYKNCISRVFFILFYYFQICENEAWRNLCMFIKIFN